MRSTVCLWLGVLAVVLFHGVTEARASGGAEVAAAAHRRDSDAVRELVRRGATVNAAESDGATALHWAAHWNDLATATLLVKAGAKPDARNDYGVTPLSLASMNGSASMIALLVDAGADPNGALPNGETPLMWAARTGEPAAVSALLARRAAVEAREHAKGQTALMWATALGHEPVVLLLIAAGADTRARSASGFTPLLFAARDGHLGIVRLLVDAGADVNERDGEGATVLLTAVVRGHTDVAEFLLNHGADPNVEERGFTPLHWIAGKWESLVTYSYPDAPGEWGALLTVPDRRIELIEALLAHGANVNARLRARPRFGMSFTFVPTPGATPFLIAAISADLDVMRLLAANGADTLLTSNDGVTPLMVAAGYGRNGETSLTEADALAGVKLLLDLGAHINAAATAAGGNAASTSGDTAMHAAASRGYDVILQFLVDHGASLSPKNSKGETPLRIASGGTISGQMVQRGTPSTAALLRKLGATE